MSIEDDLFEQRLHRIHEIEALGFQPYGHKFEFSTTIPEIWTKFGEKTAEELTPHDRVTIAGRIHTIRRMGKAAFAHLVQNGERIQIYVKKDVVSDRDYQLFQLLDLGDIIGVSTSMKLRASSCPRSEPITLARVTNAFRTSGFAIRSR